MPHVTITPNTLGGYLFDLDEFGFGKTDDTAKTQYYESILNTYDDPEQVLFDKTSSLALNFRGLGLPTKSFNRFSNLLSVITNGESTCLSRKSGYCALANECSYYRSTGLWDYDFKVKFTSAGTEDYLRVPLASFAANYAEEGGVCVIFVEYLDDSYNNSKFIIMGGMFFQSFYA